jgi:hypothetical protein
MENIETVTPEQIAKHYSSALDSVALINAGQPDNNYNNGRKRNYWKPNLYLYKGWKNGCFEWSH